MGVKWTDEQKHTIEARNTNILVSAAAGSGKTAVLVERIKRLIIEEKVPVTNMLIVTFTNAAASEMKEKIAKALTKAIEENEDGNLFLREQLDNLYKAQISTFHSFGISVMRQYFHLIDLEANFKVADDTQITIIKSQVMEELLEKKFEEGSDEFYDFLYAYSSDRSEENLKEFIHQIYEKMMALPEPWEWADRALEDLKMSREDFYNSEMCEMILDDCRKLCTIAVEKYIKAINILNENMIDYDAKLKQEITKYKNLRKIISKEISYDEIVSVIAPIAIERSKTFKATREEKERYDEIKDEFSNYRKEAKQLIKKLYEAYFKESLDIQLFKIKMTYDRSKFFISLIKEYDDMLSKAKREANVVAFSDIEHFTLELLKNEEVANQYKQKFEYIFVDEYQDSNKLQEALIDRIKRKNNLFLVGDVKQSIYRFRLAEPEIFEYRYAEFADERNSDSIKIDLNKNFRSKESVIRTVNDVFENLMDNYNEAAQLYRGDSYEGEINHTTELHIVFDDVDKDLVDENLEELKRIEKEALVTAKLIKENLGKKIWDSKLNLERSVELRDIVILLRSTKGKADVYYNKLMENDIQAYIDDNEGYFDTIEINNFMSLLTIIDNKKQDIPLVTVLKSEIFSFTIDELIKIRIENKKCKYYEALVNYSEAGKDIELRNKCAEVLTKLEYWRSLSKMLPLESFIWKLMLETGFYISIGALPGGKQRQANLRVLVDRAQEYIKMGKGSLKGFIDYIDLIKSKKIEMSQVKIVGENENLVRIMTTHKSKGLEFPIVIVGGLGSEIKPVSIEKICIDKNIGLGLSIVDIENSCYEKSLLQNCIKRKAQIETIQDEIRILYVAMTRAKDKLILLGSNKGNREDGVAELMSESVKSCMNMIFNVLFEKKYDVFCHDVDIQTFAGNNKAYYEQNNTERLISYFDADTAITDENIAREINERLSYEYPYNKSLDMKFKYSVTELNKLAQKQEIQKEYKFVPKVPNFYDDTKQFTFAEKGTLYHRVMEEIDFSRMDTSKEEQTEIVRDTLESMVSKSIFTEEEKQTIDIEKVTLFFQTSIGKRAIVAAKNKMLKKEKNFSMIMDMEGENVIVQGIIDCCFEENDELVVIDYKTSYIDSDKEMKSEQARIIAEYKEQIRIYVKALELSKNKKVKEAYIYLQNIGQAVEILNYTEI